MQLFCSSRIYNEEWLFLDVIALLLFVLIVALAFFKKMNAGVLALAVAVIAVRIFNLSDSDILAGVSASMFCTLVGLTLLFGVINSTGALDLLAHKIVALAGKRVWLLPIAIYIAGFIVSAVGPGAIPALAIIPALGVSVALKVGYSPVMLTLIGYCGMTGGRMSPLTPEAALIGSVCEEAGLTNGIPIVWLCAIIASFASAFSMYFLFKGYKLKEAKSVISLQELPKFTSKQIISLCSIVVLLIMLVVFDVNIALAAFVVAVVLILMGISEEDAVLKKLPWGTIIMVLGVGAFLGIVDAVGGIQLLSDMLASIMSSATATPIMGITAGLMSMVSSALGVVYPTLMPVCVEVAAQVGGVNPLSLIAAVAAGASLSGFTTLSTGGALMVATMSTADPSFTKEEENKLFVRLFGVAAISIIAMAIAAALFFNPIVSLLY